MKSGQAPPVIKANIFPWHQPGWRWPRALGSLLGGSFGKMNRDQRKKMKMMTKSLGPSSVVGGEIWVPILDPYHLDLTSCNLSGSSDLYISWGCQGNQDSTASDRKPRSKWCKQNKGIYWHTKLKYPGAGLPSGSTGSRGSNSEDCHLALLCLCWLPSQAASQPRLTLSFW